jgi:hypothetical protein
MDLVIEGHPAELEWIRREVERELGARADLEAVPSRDAEELREPLIIGLIVSLGGPAIVTSLVSILKRRWENQEEMERIRNELRIAELDHDYRLTELKLRVVEDDDSEHVLDERDLVAMART